MKQFFLMLGLVALSAAAGGATAYYVTANDNENIQYVTQEVERSPELGTIIRKRLYRYSHIFPEHSL